MANGCVVWVTGMSGAGKTTLCDALRLFLEPRLPELVVLDGDIIRQAFGNDLGYHKEDRIIQIKRLQNLAKVLSDQGQVVIVATIYSSSELLNWNRANLHDYFEIYLDASLDALRGRDTKGLYAKAESGEITDVVGVDITWNPPASPNLVIDSDDPDQPEKLAQKVIAAVPRFSLVFESA